MPEADDALPRASDEDGDRPRFRVPGDVAVVVDGDESVQQPAKQLKPPRRDSATRRRVKR